MTADPESESPNPANVPALRVDELEALGLYDPSSPDAHLKLELLEYLIGLGATADDLVSYHDMLPGLAAILIIRGGAGRTLDEAAEASGISPDDIRRIARAAGFPDPEPGQRLFTRGFSDLAAAAGSAIEVFGEDGFYQLMRVMGAAMSRLADAVVSVFLVEVEPAARLEDPVGLGVARANVESAALLPLVPVALDVLFRQHLMRAQRPSSQESDTEGFETQQLVVGFVDLVGSAEMAEQRTLPELGAALNAFEDLALETITRAGGRLVKLIGDEVLYTAPTMTAGAEAALELAGACERHDLLPRVRVGLAGGRVMLRGGDVFGPVVNLAARLVKAAEPGQILVPAGAAEHAGLPAALLGTRHLKGLAEEVDLASLTRNS